MGGGPAGLYFAISLKRLDPRHEVLVVERNRPDDTFGWGVVFSDQTMEALGAADHESAVTIADRIAIGCAVGGNPSKKCFMSSCKRE